MHARTIRLARGGASAVLALGASLGALALTSASAGATTVTAVSLFASPTGSGTSCTTTAPCPLPSAVTQAEADNGEAITIHLRAGTYSGSTITVTTDKAASLAFVGQGTAGATASVLSGTSTREVLILSGSPVSLSSLALSDGYTTTGSCVTDGVTLTMTHVLLSGCSAVTVAAGVYVRPEGTLHLNTSIIEKSTTTTGPAGALFIDGGASATLTGDRLFTDTAVVGGAIENDGTLTMVRDTVFDDQGAGTTTGQAGGIEIGTKSTASVTDVTFTSDSANRGGGIATGGTTWSLKVADSTFATDSAVATGGGLVAGGVHGHLSVTGSVFSNDKSAERGGAAVTTVVSATFTGDTFSDDAATTGGGAIFNFGSTLELSGSTLVGNHSGQDGGGIVTSAEGTGHPIAGTSTLTNDTFATDSSVNGGAVVDGRLSTTAMVDDTLSHDSATSRGPGLWAADGTATVSDSIFSAAGCATETGGAIVDGGYNVASTHTCITAATSISTSTTIGLLPLAANTANGPQTEAIPPKSSAYGVVPAAACTVTVTERGFTRPGAPGSQCDAGAYEYQLTGYDLVGADGGVFVLNPPNESDKGFYGSLPGIGVVPSKPVVGIVPTVTDAGYFLVAADGGVFAFGNAPFLGSLPGIKVTPNLPIVGIVAADTDKGYFLVGADGGVYAFGTVPFLGSLPGKGISASNVIGIAATPLGNGYWVVQTTGKVTAFGTAKAFTTTATTSPVTAIAGTPTGGGYWLVTKEGGVYPYGNAAKQGQGTLPNIHVVPNLPVIGIVRVAATVGYWLIGADGGIFAFGTAPFVGSLPGFIPPVTVTDIVGAVPN